jgi:transketolase
MEFVGIRNTYAESGTPAGLLDKYGLIAREVVAAARRALARKKQS